MEHIGLLILRVIPAAMMMVHGWQKMSDFSNISKMFPDLTGLGPSASLALAIFGEFFAPLFLIIGFATRLAAIPPLITMLVAAFLVHAQDPWMKQEFPILYAVIFLVLLFTGGGKYGAGNRFSSIWLKS